VCEEQVKNKKRLGWKHGNTPGRFLICIKPKWCALLSFKSAVCWLLCKIAVQIEHDKSNANNSKRFNFLIADFEIDV
jgi:hypothetical protein